jgi:CheY-like chemotaxis protein
MSKFGDFFKKIFGQQPQLDGSVWQSILIVDDDETSQKITRGILLKAGYSVLTADSGEEGLRIAQEKKPSLILLDVIMPKMKGREVCQQLKEFPDTANIPVVFLTAKNSPDDVKAEMEVGAQAHLTKPVNPEQLITVVREVLE